VRVGGDVSFFDMSLGFALPYVCAAALSTVAALDFACAAKLVFFFGRATECEMVALPYATCYC
jgi:hypothetical protein